MGQFSEQVRRSRQGRRPLRALPRRTRICRQGRLRRHRGERTSQHQLFADAGAKPDRRGAYPAREEGAHLRLGHAAQSRISQPPRRGIFDARRDVARAARSRLSARHGHGILGQSGQSGDRARTPQGIDRHHPAGLDQGRTDQLLRGFLHLSLSQPLGASAAAPASPLLYRRHRQPGDDRTRRATRLWLFGGVRHQEARAGAQQQSARAFRVLRQEDPARSIAARNHDLCRGDAGEGRAGICRAHAILLRGWPAHAAAISRPSRLSLGRSIGRARRSATCCTARSISKW